MGIRFRYKQSESPPVRSCSWEPMARPLCTDIEMLAFSHIDIHIHIQRQFSISQIEDGGMEIYIQSSLASSVLQGDRDGDSLNRGYG